MNGDDTPRLNGKNQASFADARAYVDEEDRPSVMQESRPSTDGETARLV